MFKPAFGELNNLYVKGFPLDTTEDELLEQFKQFGLVKNISIVTGKGFGYISYENSTQAEDAIIAMRSQSFKGGFLTVELYESKQKSGPAESKEAESKEDYY